MIVVVVCSFIAMLLTYLETKDQFPNGMMMGFLLLGFLGAIHYDYGNDYMAYYDIYDSITAYSVTMSDIFGGFVYKDVGWTILCLLFSHIGGFFVLVAAICIFENFVYYQLISRFVPKNLWAFSLFIYLFNYTYYLLNFSMLRQGLAIALATMAIILFIKTSHRYLIPILLLYFAYSVHSSSLICVLMYILCMFPYKNTKVLASVISVLFVLFIVFRGSMVSFIEPFLVFDTFDYFLGKYSERGQVSGLGVLFWVNSIPLFITAALYYKNELFSIDEKRIVFFATIGLMIVPFSTIALMISRLAIYFGVFSIAAFPIIYDRINNPEIKRWLTVLFVIAQLYSYYDFFTSDTYSKSYAEFKTIFSVM